ncbi:MAG: tRNA-(ms[2]io[6]A)-hydroxylase [Planctomycetota bacterium]|nr:tRNA-(ms[2]io[6]A)-hydroxylase [Planctomycetota bacterium]
MRGSIDDLPLLYRTPEAWARGVLRDPVALLSDHAHLEKKAAANALELLNRWPHNGNAAAPPDWVQAMAAIARDEVEHLAAVTRLISRRGGQLARLHRNPYATALRGLVRLGQGTDELLDRLLVSALIEARSCERFELLAKADPPEDLGKLYAGLCASERGHYLTFLDLGRLAVDELQVQERWASMLRAEAEIAAAQALGPGMHSGMIDAPVSQPVRGPGK